MDKQKNNDVLSAQQVSKAAQLSQENTTKLIIALDNMSEKEAKKIIERITKECPLYMDRIIFKFNDLIADIWLKWIDRMFNWVKWLRWFKWFGWLKWEIMLDPKWFDIPNTDANYIRKLWKYELSQRAVYVTMHASNWYAALKKAVDTRNKLWIKTKILAVTALTTFDDTETNRIFDETSKHSVLKLCKEALDAWVDWIVCSPMEAQLLRDVFRDYDFEIITPWVRFEWWDKGDQKRVMTPQKAKEQGSSHIVMWRPILWSEDPKVAVERYFNETKWVWYMPNEKRNEFERVVCTWSWEELLRYIGAFYNKPEWGKFCRLASWLLSNAYINIWASERNYLVVERAANDMATEVKKQWIEADVIMWAQMWSVRMSLVLAEKLWIEESVYTEKNEYDNSESMKIDWRNMTHKNREWWDNHFLTDVKDWEYVMKLPKEEQTMMLTQLRANAF